METGSVSNDYLDLQQPITNQRNTFHPLNFMTCTECDHIAPVNECCLRRSVDKMCGVYKDGEKPVLLKTKHVELEIAGFLFFRAPWLGSVYIGPDSGCGYVVRSRPNEIDAMRRDYIERTRQTLRVRR